MATWWQADKPYLVPVEALCDTCWSTFQTLFSYCNFMVTSVSDYHAPILPLKKPYFTGSQGIERVKKINYLYFYRCRKCSLTDDTNATVKWFKLNSNWQFDQNNLPAVWIILFSITPQHWLIVSTKVYHLNIVYWSKQHNQGWWWLPNVFITVSVNSLSWNKWNTLHVGVTFQVVIRL